MTHHNQGLGAYGESVAARALAEQGMVVLARNWRGQDGEIDLVLRDGQTLVFCEVKTRTSADRGHPLEAVDEAKLQRLNRLAAQWVEAHQIRPRGVRFDLVGVLRPPHGATVVEHVAGVG